MMNNPLFPVSVVEATGGEHSGDDANRKREYWYQTPENESACLVDIDPSHAGRGGYGHIIVSHKTWDAALVLVRRGHLPHVIVARGSAPSTIHARDYALRVDVRMALMAPDDAVAVVQAMVAPWINEPDEVRRMLAFQLPEPYRTHAQQT